MFGFNDLLIEKLSDFFVDAKQNFSDEEMVALNANITQTILGFNKFIKNHMFLKRVNEEVKKAINNAFKSTNLSSYCQKYLEEIEPVRFDMFCDVKSFYLSLTVFHIWSFYSKGLVNEQNIFMFDVHFKTCVLTNHLPASKFYENYIKTYANFEKGDILMILKLIYHQVLYCLSHIVWVDVYKDFIEKKAAEIDEVEKEVALNALWILEQIECNFADGVKKFEPERIIKQIKFFVENNYKNFSSIYDYAIFSKNANMLASEDMFVKDTDGSKGVEKILERNESGKTIISEYDEVLLEEDTSLSREDTDVLEENTDVSEDDESLLKEDASISEENTSTLEVSVNESKEDRNSRLIEQLNSFPEYQNVNNLLLLLTVTSSKKLNTSLLNDNNVMRNINLSLMMHSILYLSLSFADDDVVCKRLFISDFSSSYMFIEEYCPDVEKILSSTEVSHQERKKESIAVIAIDYMVQFISRITDYKLTYELHPDFYKQCLKACKDMELKKLELVPKDDMPQPKALLTSSLISAPVVPLFEASKRNPSAKVSPPKKKLKPTIKVKFG